MRKEAIPLYLFSFVMIMPMQALLPVLPMIRDEISASYLQISFFVACLGVVRLFFAFPSGFLADRYDRKKILISSGLLCICGLLVLCFSNTFFELIVSRVLVGFGSILCNITVLVLLVEIAGPDSKGILLSMNNVVHNAGGIVGPALAGVLAGWYHWRLPFGVVAGLILMSVLVIVFFFTDHWQNAKWDDSEGKKGGFRSQDSIKTSIIKLTPVFAIGFFVFFYRGSFRHTLIPFYGQDVFQIGVQALGFYISLMGGIAMISLPVLGHMSDRFGRKVVLMPGILFSAAAVLALLLPRAYNPLLLCSLFVGIGAIINSMPNILISDLIPSGSTGRAMGINRMFADSGYFLGSIVAGSLLDHFGFRIPLYFIAGYAGIILILAGFSIHNKPVKRG